MIILTPEYVDVSSPLEGAVPQRITIIESAYTPSRPRDWLEHGYGHMESGVHSIRRREMERWGIVIDTTDHLVALLADERNPYTWLDYEQYLSGTYLELRTEEHRW